MFEAAYTLAMLALQSERYANDVEYRDAVDRVLAIYWGHYGSAKGK